MTTTKLGDYIILDKIAHGGMAEVYKAKTSDPLGIERLVVIKRILPHIASQPEYVEMLVDEAKIAVHFTHGNIAQVYDLGRIGDDYFIVMEYVDGRTLSQILRAFRDKPDPIPVDVVVYTMMEICRALDYIHNKKDVSGVPLGIVHRDISPQNIIISYSGNIKVIDFGVAKSLEKLNQTEAGVLKGKFAYMSPEQARGQLVDHQSDLFSVGILLWELLTQTRLFKRNNNKETVQAVLKYKIPKPSDLRPEISSSLEKIIMKALSRYKWFRYKQAADIADDLEKLLYKEYPDFRPLHIAEFLYRYFGPEADESHLPLEIKLPPVDLEKTKKTSQVSIHTEKTKKEKIKIPFLFKLKSKPLKYLAAPLGLLIISMFFLFLGQHKARLILEINPGSAFVSLNDEEIERVPEGLYALDVDANEKISLKVKQSGKKDFVASLELMDGETKKMNVQLEESSTIAQNLWVETVPAGAEIFLDDKPINHQTPYELKSLKGNHDYKIGFYLPNYQYEEKSFRVSDQQNQKITVNLKILVAGIEINSTPAGASIYVNGDYWGMTPYVNLNLIPGQTYEFDFKLDGYVSQHITTQLKAGEKKPLSIDLIPL
ncbi:MAG: Serine/threonine protein kinase [uncultured bacterium]|nr:MAG: Serine/threonine protein kinase [uncultured bacterium]